MRLDTCIFKRQHEIHFLYLVLNEGDNDKIYSIPTTLRKCQKLQYKRHQQQKRFTIFHPRRGSIGRPMAVVRVVERGAGTAAVLKRCLYNTTAECPVDFLSFLISSVLPCFDFTSTKYIQITAYTAGEFFVMAKVHRLPSLSHHSQHSKRTY